MGFGELSHRRLELGVSPPRPALLGPGWRPWCRHSESVSGAQGACSLPLTALCLPPVRSVGQGPRCRMPCPLAVAQGPQITPSGGSSPSWSCLHAPLAGRWVGWSKPGLALCPGRSQGPTAATTGAPILSWWGPRAAHSRSMTPSPGGFVALLFPGVHTCLSRPRPGGGPAPGLVSPEPAQAGADGSGLQPPEPLTRAQPLSRLWGSPVTTPPGPVASRAAGRAAAGGGVRPGSCPVLCFTAAVARWCPQCEDADPGQLLLRRASAVSPPPPPRSVWSPSVSSSALVGFFLGCFSFPLAPSPPPFGS